MTKEQIFEVIKKSAQLLTTNQNGYFAVSQLGASLLRNNFDYNQNGYKKLLDLLKDFENEIDISINEVPSKLPYAKIKELDNNEQLLPVKLSNQKKIENLDFDGWGIIFDCNTKLAKLKEMALPETWHYGKNDDGTNPILKNYLLFTFKRLYREENKILQNDELAVFDTGLVNSRYDSIYAIFSKNANYQKDKSKYHEWVLSAFSTEADRYWGLQLGNNFNPLPKRTNYFSTADEMYYDTNQMPPTLSDNHIIIDNIDRFPIDFLEEHIGTIFDIRHIFSLPILDKDKEIKLIKDYLKKNDKVVINMRNRLKDAIEVAIKRVQWNFKTAIPLYYVKENSMSLLIPLALRDDNKVDIALVVMRMKAGGYRGMTILTLEQAYTSARLVSRPDSDWLIAREIEV
jgi:hypothetical protein